jgi:hypothetical protein
MFTKTIKTFSKSYPMKTIGSKFQFLIVTLLLITTTTMAQNNVPSEKVFHQIMLINWADTLDNSAKTEVINLFLGLPDKINGFESFEINDLSKSTERFEQVMILRFTSKESVKAYENHADHLRIQEISPPLLSGFSLFEYWE